MLRTKRPTRLLKKRIPSYRGASRGYLVGSLRHLVEQMEEGFSTLRQERIEAFVQAQSCGSMIEELAQGADTFLAGLRTQLNKKEADLFLCLIHRVSNADGSIRALSYSEIGARLDHVSKQAVASRVARLKRNHPKVWEYVEAIRNPKPEVPFSSLSPSARDKKGIEKCYNYNAG